MYKTQVKKLVKTQTKGMVTIPVEFRERLGISTNNLLEATLVENGVLFRKIDYGTPQVNLPYADEEITEWMKEDKLDPKTASKLKQLLQ